MKSEVDEEKMVVQKKRKCACPSSTADDVMAGDACEFATIAEKSNYTELFAWYQSITK